VELIAEVLHELGAAHALVVHGTDGLDEITTTGPTHIGEVRDGRVRVYMMDPADFGVPRARLDDLVGGSPEDNAALMHRVLGGETGPLADITALNAGAAVYVAGLAPSLEDGYRQAAAALASGAAGRKLAELKEFLA
jgi:anthranilate phosphoribosyltransferase